MLNPKPTFDPLSSLFTPRKYGQPTPAAPLPQAPMAPQAPVRSVLKKGNMAFLERSDVRHAGYPWFPGDPAEERELRLRRRGLLPDPEPLPDEVEPADLEDPVVEGVPPLPRNYPGQPGTPRDPGDVPFPGLFRKDRVPEPEPEPDSSTPEWMRFVKRQPVPLPDPRNYQPGLQGLLG